MGVNSDGVARSRMHGKKYDDFHARVFGKEKKVEKGRFYYFTMSDGTTRSMTLQEAIKLKDPAIRRRLNEIRENSKNKRMKKDGFESGWQESTQSYASSHKDYTRQLNERGLVEIGNDYIPQDSSVDVNPCANKEFVQTMVEEGVEMTDGLAESITSGEIFED